MNQSSSSSKTHYQKSSTVTAWQDSLMQEKNKKQKQQKRSSRRSPFQDLNNGGFTSNDTSSCNASSLEAPKGCLRFFLSHTSSSSAKTPFSTTGCSNNKERPNRVKLMSSPMSAPNMRPGKEKNPSKRSIFYKPISQKSEKVKENPPKSGTNNRPSSSHVTSLKLSSGFNSSDCSVTLTPLNKVATGCGLNRAIDNRVMNANDEQSHSVCNANTNSTSSKTKTPPIQASVSPEIQCGSSMASTAVKTITPVCYGAGYVVSGVIDKRKCRPRGILTVGEAKPLDCFDSDYESEKENTPGPVNNSRDSLLPLPTEASMHWLLSPCNEEDEDRKANSEDGSCCFQKLEETEMSNFHASPLSGNGVFSPDSFSNSDRSISNDNSRRKTRSSSLLSSIPSPSTGFLCPGTEKQKCYDPDEGKSKSPFSRDSLGSGNIIQTPESDSSLDRRVGISWFNANDGRKNYNFDSDLNPVAEHLQMASLSPKSHVSMWDPMSSSFQFDCLTTSSNSIDLSRIRKFLDDRVSWLSNSTVENVSQSQMRISWREGLVSRIFEMDEFDSCRCLSDEEVEAEAAADACCLKLQCSSDLNVHTVGEQASTTSAECTIFTHSDRKIDEKAKNEITLQVAESISTDGNGLVRSDDSDWTLCYKNRLFQL